MGKKSGPSGKSLKNKSKPGIYLGTTNLVWHGLYQRLMQGYPILVGSMYGIYTYIYHKNQPNVGKYKSYMDPMGINKHNKHSTVKHLHWYFVCPVAQAFKNRCKFLVLWGNMVYQTSNTPNVTGCLYKLEPNWPLFRGVDLPCGSNLQKYGSFGF